jgi:hypothetical protein
METFTVTLQLVGPLKRSTFWRGTPDPILEGTNDVLHWSWSLNSMDCARACTTM